MNWLRKVSCTQFSGILSSSPGSDKNPAQRTGKGLAPPVDRSCPRPSGCVQSQVVLPAAQPLRVMPAVGLPSLPALVPGGLSSETLVPRSCLLKPLHFVWPWFLPLGTCHSPCLPSSCASGHPGAGLPIPEVGSLQNSSNGLVNSLKGPQPEDSGPQTVNEFDCKYFCFFKI